MRLPTPQLDIQGRRWNFESGGPKLHEAYLHTKWRLDACRRLTTIEMGQKLGRGLCPLFGRVEQGRYLTQRRLG